jgi:endoglucanase
MKLLKDDLYALVSVPGVSGCEAAARGAAAELLRPYVDTLAVDTAGNLIGFLAANAKRDTSPDVPLLCWCAHIDEVGLIVSGHKGGFLTFNTVGSVDARVLPNAQVDIASEPMRSGIVTCLPPHVLDAEDSKRAFTLEELWIDTGLRAEDAALIPIGTRAVFRRGLVELGGAAAAPALDNRACFTAMLEALRRLEKRRTFDLMVCATSAEESGRVGAASLDTKDCDACIVLDVTFAHMPGLPQTDTVPRRAAAIGVGPNITRRLSDIAVDTAVRHEIPFSREVLPADTGTDAWMLQVSKTGIPTLLLSLPILSMHTPVETAYWADICHLAELLARTSERISAEA